MSSFEKKIKNQRGLTVIELLVAISIGTLVLIIAFNVLNILLNSYKNNVVKSNLQQEANIIMTTMTNLFQQTNQYTIEMTNNDKLNISSKQNQLFSFEKEVYNYSIKIDGTAIAQGSSVTLSTNKPIIVDIYISDIKNPKNLVHISTILKRL
jgi:prepilin-type N-terminal cleavage/methylation domain-containing protein